jgi:SAM-dependent methyltransferase
MDMQPMLSNNDLAPSGKSLNDQLLQLRQWIFDKTVGCAEGACLEIFSGNGAFSQLFLEAGVRLVISDPTAQSLLHIDPYSPDFEISCFEHLQKFDTVFAINFLQYGPLTVKAVGNIKKLLTPGGYLVTWFPAYTALFNQMDQAFNNWHRNNKVDVKKVLGRDFEIVKMRYFCVQDIEPESPPVEDNSQTKFEEMVRVFQIDDPAADYRGISMITVAQLIS